MEGIVKYKFSPTHVLYPKYVSGSVKCYIVRRLEFRRPGFSPSSAIKNKLFHFLGQQF